ncbi:MAG: hypothetical protein IJ228_00520 [Succinivibrio sp.]|nr:hypothetical protein [Succinivibrio sp.]
MSMTTAFTMFAKKVCHEKTPFAVSIGFSKQNMERLRKSVAQMEKAGGSIHEVDGVL